MNTRKLNRGLLLTGAVILAVIIYLVVVLVYRKGELPKISETIQGCMEAQLDAVVLPSHMDDKTFESYKTEKTDAVLSFYKKGRNADRQIKLLISKLESQNNGSEEAITSISKKNTSEVNVLSYANGLVKASVSADISVNKYSGESGGNQTYTYILVKTDDGYKVVDCDFSTDSGLLYDTENYGDWGKD